LDFDETWEQIFALLTTGSGKTKEMVIDSGATTTMTPKRNAFVTYKQIKPGLFVRTANNARIPVVGIGIIKAGQMQLQALHVPDLHQTLVSILDANKAGYDVYFLKNFKVLFLDPDGNVAQTGRLNGNQFILDTGDTEVDDLSAASLVDIPEAFPMADGDHIVLAAYKEDHLTWHHRLGHPGGERLQLLQKRSTGMPNFTVPPGFKCPPWLLSKSHKLPHKAAIRKALKILEGFFMDLWGPNRHASYGGKKYAFLIVCYASRYAWIFFLAKKSEMIVKFMEFVAWVTTQNNGVCPIKLVKDDGGGEFMAAEYLDLIKARGWEHEVTPRDSPSCNGIPERRLAPIMNSVTAMMTVGIHDPLWTEITATSVTLGNFLPTKGNEDSRSPYEVLRAVSTMSPI